MGEFDENQPVSHNDWETVKNGKENAIEKWINDNMRYRSCVIVLIGQETAQRPWVKYEIKKAWADKKGLLGIHIHNLKDPKTGTCSKGANPFEQFSFENGSKLSTRVNCYNPSSLDAYNDIKENISKWVDAAIASRQ